MRIKVYVKDLSIDKVLEELGECVTDSPARALQMYEGEQMKWAEQGYEPSLCYENISDPAAVSLGRRGGSVTSEAKTAAARQNAKKGGWPKGKPRKARK